MNHDELIERLGWLKEYEHVSIASIAGDAIAALREMKQQINTLQAGTHLCAGYDALVLDNERLALELDSIIEKCVDVCKKEAGEKPQEYCDWKEGRYEGAIDCADSIMAMKGKK